jgi:hypothetical protein
MSEDKKYQKQGVDMEVADTREAALLAYNNINVTDQARDLALKQ